MTDGRFVITRKMPPPAEDIIRNAGLALQVIDQVEPPTREAFLDTIRGSVGLITMLSDRVDAEALEAAGNDLKVVANYAVGYDNIDLDACRRRGIRVTNTPGVLTDATADLAWTLILAAARNVVAGDQLVRRGAWKGWAPTQFLGLQLRGATLGIVGAGRIGTAVALRSAGFSMRVLYADQQRNADLEEKLGARQVALDELLERADVVSLHVPMRPENRHLLGATQFKRMKSTAVLVNTARGPVVDETALVAALRGGEIAAAGLDVYEEEPTVHPDLPSLPNVVLLPHLGSATTATRRKMSEMAAENALAVLRGDEPANAVV